jgi:hypothetical protein
MGERKGVYRVLVKKPGERHHLVDPDMEGRIILRWVFRKLDVDWIEPVQDMDRWRALVSAIMNLQVP